MALREIVTDSTEEETVNGRVVCELGEWTPSGRRMDGTLRLVWWEDDTMTVERLSVVNALEGIKDEWYQVAQADHVDMANGMRLMEMVARNLYGV